MPDRDAAPTGTVFLKFFDDAIRFFGVAKGNKDLIEDDVVQDLEAGRGKLIGETAGLLAVAFNQPGEAIPA